MRRSSSTTVVAMGLGFAAMSSCSDDVRSRPAVVEPSSTRESDRPNADVASLHSDLEAIRRELTSIREALEQKPAAVPTPAEGDDWSRVAHDAEMRALADAVARKRQELWSQLDFWTEASKQSDFHTEHGEAVPQQLCAEIVESYRKALADVESVRTFEDLAQFERKHQLWKH